MVYLDTSAAFPIFVPEENSERIAAWFDGSDDPLIASDWFVTEFSSALALNQRQGKIDEEQAAEIWQGFLVFFPGVCAASGVSPRGNGEMRPR